MAEAPEEENTYLDRKLEAAKPRQEAAVKGIPMVHTPPIPGVETLNAQFFAERGMSVFAPNEDSAADNAIRLALDPSQRVRMLAAQKQYLTPLAADRIAARILGTPAVGTDG